MKYTFAAAKTKTGSLKWLGRKEAGVTGEERVTKSQRWQGIQETVAGKIKRKKFKKLLAE